MSYEDDKQPLIPASTFLPEFTVKAIILSLILAAVLAASNAYLALKLGQTISASIPASVLALGILRFFKNSNVLESNLAQTAASAGEGVAAAISFVLPAMILVHAWIGFPYWETTLVTMAGGLLGVLFSIPLRPILLNLPELSFPEGTAIGNVLKASTQGGAHMKYLAQGGLVGAAISFAQDGLQFISDNWQMWTFTRQSLFGIGIGFSPALIAAGYIVGVQVGLSLLVGIILGWIVVLPGLAIYYHVPHTGDAYDAVMDLWSNHLRFVGVGTMLVGGFFTLAELIRPIIKGFARSWKAMGHAKTLVGGVPRTEKDMPTPYVLIGLGLLTLALLPLVGRYIYNLHIFDANVQIALTTIFSVCYIFVIGFILATICGYFTGLIGSSNNPLSGILIIAVIILSLLYLVLFHGYTASQGTHVISVVILVITVIAAVASISNENIQDLKAGQMVGATPWKQQLMLALGVIVSALIIGPVLNLLFNAYGIAGVYPRPGMDPSQMLAAPQASLMAAVAQGVIMHKLEWNMIGLGGLVAIFTILVDRYLRTKNKRLPTLAVGLGIYLPPEVMTPAVIGALINYAVKTQLRKKVSGNVLSDERYNRGVLLACGLVAGSALMGVMLAIPFVIADNSSVLAIVGPNFIEIANILGMLCLIGVAAWLYRTATR
ncbi:MAG: Oligopeptide transporter [Gammaproteobacteria bacterium]|jgi:putative OPT family oligopeptide transporter|nr:Oligopeptide transporter [Gammaproteobacteria bacterium]